VHVEPAFAGGYDIHVSLSEIAMRAVDLDARYPGT